MIPNFQQTKYIRGTTLIEVMIYVALFSIMIGGAVVVAYQMVAGSGRSGTEAILEDDGAYLLGKMRLLLSNADKVILPATPVFPHCNMSGTLALLSRDASVGLIVIDVAHDTLRISQHSAIPVDLSPGIEVNDFTVLRCVEDKLLAREYLDVSFTLSTRTPNGMIIQKAYRTKIAR